MYKRQSETMSGIIDWEDRNTAVLFGDGAGAVVLSAVDGLSLIHISEPTRPY